MSLTGAEVGGLAVAQSSQGVGSPAFFISLGIFVFILLAIALRWMHETAAALLGAVLLWLVHYLGGSVHPALRIIGFDEAIAAVDWNVIFLILGMMIFMAMFSETGVFRWLAYRVFRLTRGNSWLLGLVLVLLTGFVSSLLNNVTAMLLLVPLSIQIAETVGVHPFAYVIPEVMAANIGGAATLIGDPPSTIVGSYLGLGFWEYALRAAPFVLTALVLLVGLSLLLYRRELAVTRKRASPVLLRELEARSRITNAPLLRKAGLVGMATLFLFFVAERFDLPPSVVAMTGAVWLVVWVRPDMPRMLQQVDWTTLFFFIGIFVVVAGLERSGVVTTMAQALSRVAGDSLPKATALMVWTSGLFSGVVDNIPITVSLLPIASQLSQTIPAAHANSVLFWALVLGADLGGNLTYVGGAANIVAVGLLAQAGYRISFGRFLRDGAVVTVVSLLLVTVWLLILW